MRTALTGTSDGVRNNHLVANASQPKQHGPLFASDSQYHLAIASREAVQAQKSQPEFGWRVGDGNVFEAGGGLAQFQPLLSIRRTAALFLAPICSADTPSGLKLPKRCRIGLLPVPLSGYSLFASA